MDFGDIFELGLRKNNVSNGNRNTKDRTGQALEIQKQLNGKREGTETINGSGIGTRMVAKIYPVQT